jgi:hypothetical protein
MVLFALIMRNIWASALVFIVGILVIGTVELKRMQKVQSQFLKARTIKVVNKSVATYSDFKERPYNFN